MELENRIKEIALTFGFSFVEIASADPPPWSEELDKWLGSHHHGDMDWMERNIELRKNPRGLMDSAKSILTLGLNYFQHPEFFVHQDDPSRGNISLYAWGKDYHDLIRERLHLLAAELKKELIPDLKYRAFVDTAPLLERPIGFSANLGFIGKNSLLIRSGFGSYFFLGELLINRELTPTESPEKNRGCGKCVFCKTHCPTGALDSEYTVAAEKCISYLTIENKGPIPVEFRKNMGNRIYGCDQCQVVCPYNKKNPPETKESHFLINDSTFATPSLIELMELDDEGFNSRFKGSAIKRIKRQGLQRNVAVALGNWGDRKALPVLRKAMSDLEPLIRGHAVWSYGQIEKNETGLNFLKEKRTTESDPYVLSEIDSIFNFRS